jgi:hypothetical protein
VGAGGSAAFPSASSVRVAVPLRAPTALLGGAADPARANVGWSGFLPRRVQLTCPDTAAAPSAADGRAAAAAAAASPGSADALGARPVVTFLSAAPLSFAGSLIPLDVLDASVAAGAGAPLVAAASGGAAAANASNAAVGAAAGLSAATLLRTSLTGSL